MLPDQDQTRHLGSALTENQTHNLSVYGTVPQQAEPHQPELKPEFLKIKPVKALSYFL